ncbi:MAG: MFS transporter [Coriobacteriia bacterium]|nr:MFS transporter [Coriobacteriia bacterium]
MSSDLGPEDCPMTADKAVKMSKGAYRRLAANPKFRRLWLSQLVSGIGDWLVIGFLMPLVTTLSGGSSFAVAGIMIAKIIPALLFSSVIGVLVDRFDRRRTMIVADLSRAVLALGLIAIAGLSAGVQLALIYAVVLAMETASLFFFPAKNALIPYLVDEEDITAANGLSYTTQQASMLVGLAGAGAILAGFESIVRTVQSANLPGLDTIIEFFAPALLGPRAGVFLDTLTFLVSAVAIYGIHLNARASHADGHFDITLLGKDVLESFRFLRYHTELRGFLLTIGLAILGGGAIIPVGLVFVQQELSGLGPFLSQSQLLQQLAATPQTFMLVLLALGMVSGALLVPRLAQVMSLQLLFLGGVAGFGVTMGGFASVGTYGWAGLFAAAAGFCLAAVTVAGNTYVVETVADEIRGRVFTALESVIRVCLLLSMIIMAPLGDFAAKIVRRVVESQGGELAMVTVTGSQLALQLSALIVVGAAVYAFRTLNWRRPAEEPADA